MGRLTRDPEVRYSNNGNNTAICRFSVAVDRRFQKPGEERQADFISVTAFGKTGEFVSRYFVKGNRVALVGSLQTRTWDDAEGKKHYATEVVAEETYFTGEKKNDTSTSNGGFYPQFDAEEDLPF